MTSQKNKTQKSSKITQLFTKKPWLKWLIIVVLIGALAYAGKTLSQRQQANKQFELMQKQRQLMIETFEEQGLSEEEIQQKMKQSRPTRSPDQEPSEGFDPMRMGGK